ncbi:MAG: hypothetical protein J6A19_04420 [Oscillospiraceae bacterium]|nr:hypothetical protein [Oscillospiraceae bacterium]
MIKHIKRLTALSLSAIMLMVSGTVGYAENSEEYVDDGYTTMSIEQFSELAAEYGAVVMKESQYQPVARMDNYFDIELTSNNWTEVGTDIPFLNENVRVTVITISDNIDSVDVWLWERHTNKSYTENNMQEGDITDIFEVTFWNGYNVKVKANSSPALSSTNKGRVKLYWSDKY